MDEQLYPTILCKFNYFSYALMPLRFHNTQSQRHLTGCHGITDALHDDVIKWKHFPRNWTFVRGIHRSPVNSPHKGQWSGALMFSLICVWINGWVNNREAGVFWRHRAHYDVTLMGITDVLATQRSRASATIVLTSFSRNIPWSAPEDIMRT